MCNHPSWLTRYRGARAAYPVLLWNEQPLTRERAMNLLGLAPDGGCLAADVTTGTGGLLHHLFTLTWKSMTSRRSFSVVLSTGFPARELPGTVLGGARTFLRRAASPAIARSTHVYYHHTVCKPKWSTLKNLEQPFYC